MDGGIPDRVRLYGGPSRDSKDLLHASDNKTYEYETTQLVPSLSRLSTNGLLDDRTSSLSTFPSMISRIRIDLRCTGPGLFVRLPDTFAYQVGNKSWSSRIGYVGDPTSKIVCCTTGYSAGRVKFKSPTGSNSNYSGSATELLPG